MKGIFCLEGEWDRDLRSRGSVLPTLKHLEGLGVAQYIHKDVATKGELEYYTSALLEAKYKDYLVVYLAMHGSAGSLWLNGRDPTPLSLAELGQMLKGRCSGRAVYLGSCLTMGVDDATLKEFMRVTGAWLLCGYTTSVDWLESSALDLVLLERLVNANRRDGPQRYLRARGLEAFTQRLGVRFISP